jgi:hypothetical protein
MERNVNRIIPSFAKVYLTGVVPFGTVSHKFNFNFIIIIIINNLLLLLSFN